MKNQMNQKQNSLITKATPRTEARLRDHYSRGQRRIAWITLFCFFVSPATAFADTTETSIGNADTIDGTFTANTEENTTFDQSTRSAVIHWDQMDQQANNTLTFIQSQNESVLNQAQGVTASVFRGMVKCGGECIFANEAGVTFADGSYLDVGRLVAVAGTVDEDDFRADKLHAAGVTGEVTHFGEIHADSAVLIGARISNGGELYIANGSLTAVVGNEIWITEHDSNVIIHATIPDTIPGTTGGSGDGGEFNQEPAIDNFGTIDAGGGQVRMLAGDMLSFAIRNTGTIRAQEIALEADSGLVEVSGDSVLDASSLEEGGVGGSIKVLGDYVAIADNASLDASGHSGGGEILVGGDRAGADGTPTSEGTYVGKNTTLRADATHSGDGGKVIVWADKTTRSYGAISARGGVLSGNGGFVETSGLETLDVTNSPLVHARSGNAVDRGGEWLLDPFNIDIV
ncbi:MAG TPA: filamentous hemagglutinin N-terminal domain-containing protein, partial [Myxococcales bacterium]|nr:filamentous hemagglutinin N-terminal domain-containing protein [Myxococcales bacterium]